MTDPKLNTPCSFGPASPWPDDLDPDRAVSQLVSMLMTRGLDGTEGAFRALTQLNEDIRTKPRDVLLQALTRQAPLLETLFMINVRDAIETTRVEHKAAYTATALKCQKSLLATLGAIHRLSEEGKTLEIE